MEDAAKKQEKMRAELQRRIDEANAALMGGAQVGGCRRGPLRRLRRTQLGFWPAAL